MSDSNPQLLFNNVARALDQRDLAFIFARQAEGGEAYVNGIRQNYNGTLILNAGLTLESARAALLSGRADAAAFGRAFISNPDLVRRLREGIELSDWDAASFYGDGSKGYTDYPSLSCKVEAAA